MKLHLALPITLLACAGAGGTPIEVSSLGRLTCMHELSGSPRAGGRTEPEPSILYRLPFDARTPRLLAQGVGGREEAERPNLGAFGASSRATGPRGRSHRGPHRYAFDFAMPVGTEVLAARSGVVDCALGDTVTVLHPDGTHGLYAHLSASEVEPGQEVSAGELIARSGADGEPIPHLHFTVLRRAQGGIETVPIRFEDGTSGGSVPIAGQYYGGGR